MRKYGIFETLSLLANLLYLVRNFSFAFNVLLDGLPKGLKVVMSEDDCLSLNYTIKNSEFAFDIIEVHKRILEENILSAKIPSTLQRQYKEV